MKFKQFIPRAIYILILCIACLPVYASRTVKGTLISTSLTEDSITIQSDGWKMTLKPAANAQIERGQVGKEMKPVQLREFAPGDVVTATFEQPDRAVSLKAIYGLIRGTYQQTLGDNIILQDGRVVNTTPSAQIVLPNGKIGRAKDIPPGSMVICRMNPLSSQAWTVIATTSVTQPNAKQNISPRAQEKPRITSITYSSPTPLKTGDILTVDLCGTPGGAASFDIKGLVINARMKELSPGSYRAEMEIPKGKSVRAMPLIGHLVIGNMQATPVQASRLVTVDMNIITPVRPSIPPLAFTSVNAPVSQPAPKPAVVVKQTPPPAQTSKIVITNPPDDARIAKALLIRGTAEPDSNVAISVTYSNGMVGLLKLSGNVLSQTIAVGKNGEFRFGPVPLEGRLATKGLRFTIKAYYPDRADHGTAQVTVVGERKTD